MTTEAFITFCGCRDPMKVVIPDPFGLETLKRVVHNELSEDVDAWYFFDEVTEIELESTTVPNKDSTGAIYIHCHPCNEVNTMVHFESKQVSLKLSPAVLLEVVLKKVIDEFKLDADDSGAYLLSLTGDEASIPLHTPIGTLTGTKGCTVDLDLVMQPKFNG